MTLTLNNVHDNYVDANGDYDDHEVDGDDVQDVSQANKILSSKLCHLYHMVMSNLLERVCKAVMTMRGISVQKK